jgi:sugar-specific transcriptional regulator TrmB
MNDMADTRKSDEALRKIQELRQNMKSHESRVAQLEREKSDRVRSYDQQIKNEQDLINQFNRQINDLKRQI